jgi:hypothetical protein
LGIKEDMTREEIMDMANQAGLVGKPTYTEGLEAFAKLVAQHEREACAKIVEESSLPDTYSQECLPEIANDIRARGQA